MSTNTYKKIFTKGPESALPGAYEEDIIRFTTDTGRLFVDNSSSRIEVTDFVRGLTEVEIKAQFAPITSKIYIASDTHRFLIYDTDNDDWENIAVVDSDTENIIVDIQRIGYDFIATRINGSTFSFTNNGVRTISEGTTNGTINVNTNGTTADVAVHGLQALAYKASLGKSDVGLGNVANLDQSKAITSITRSGTTFTATAIDGTTSSFTQQDNNTTYTGANGISLSGTTFSNSGVRSIATGGTNGTINVNTNGTTANVAVKGLGDLAYKASLGKSDVGLSNVANLDQSKAIKSITRSGTTFTATAIDGSTSSFTQQDNNTTYTGANGVSLSGTTFSNSGVRSIATGGSNGTINVNTNGSTANVSVKGLGSAAYTESSAYATSGHTHNYAGSSSAGGVANSANKLYEASTNMGAYASSDTHILKLGYFNCSWSYDNLTLFITSAFWGNQHGSADIISIQQDLNNNSSGSIKHNIYRLHVGGSHIRTFYYKNDSSNNRVYLYVYVSGGNSYGRWNISTIQDSSTTTFVRDLATNQSTDGLNTIGDVYGNSIYKNADSAATGNTVALRDSNGYLYATYLNQSSGAENPSTASYLMYCNSDGWLRKSSLANIKSILGLKSAAYYDTSIFRVTNGAGTWSCSGNGQNYYYRIAVITIGGAYVNGPILFHLGGRGYQQTNLIIRFASTSSTDPDLEFIQSDIYQGYYIKKTATSTWEVYGRYNELWGRADLYYIENYSVGITIKMENIGQSLPDGCSQATKIFAFDSDLTSIRTNITNMQSDISNLQLAIGFPSTASGNTINFTSVPNNCLLRFIMMNTAPYFADVYIIIGSGSVSAIKTQSSSSYITNYSYSNGTLSITTEMSYSGNRYYALQLISQNKI